jgi:hypothetical protein
MHTTLSFVTGPRAIHEEKYPFSGSIIPGRQKRNWLRCRIGSFFSVFSFPRTVLIAEGRKAFKFGQQWSFVMNGSFFYSCSLWMHLRIFRPISIFRQSKIIHKNRKRKITYGKPYNLALDITVLGTHVQPQIRKVSVTLPCAMSVVRSIGTETE